MKIYINGEEVVCSNELTITEEMLTTSSTILNKVIDECNFTSSKLITSCISASSKSSKA